MMTTQLGFFQSDDIRSESQAKPLEGFKYLSQFITAVHERTIVSKIRELPFREFEFHGYLGKRRVVSFGWRYDYSGGGKLQKAPAIPDYLLELRTLAASFAHVEPQSFQQVLVTEYTAGTGIGWHRDKAVFGEVVGVSLLSPCVLRFRRKLDANTKVEKTKWERVNVEVEPRSAYLLSGPARQVWEHSILRVDQLRYAITFRSLRE
jgi:alkylated DNA repair dioxygenase AlkB